MASPRTLSAGEEEVLLEVRPHWVGLVGPGLVVLLILAGWAYLLPRVPEGELHDALWWALVAGGSAVLLAHPAPRALRWATSRLVVTNARIVHREGVLARSALEIPLEALQEVRVRRGPVAWALGTGDLVVECEGEPTLRVFTRMPRPERVREAVARAGEPGSSRRLPPAAPSTATELERLADLRVRGVLTEEEFLAQKARILGRR